MVPPSLDAPTIYTAVDLETALGATLKKQESELREMEERKRELQELSKQQKFRPSDEVSTFKIIKSVKERRCYCNARGLGKERILVYSSRRYAAHN